MPHSSNRPSQSFFPPTRDPGRTSTSMASVYPTELPHTKGTFLKDGLLQRLFHELVRDHTEAEVHCCQPHTREPLPLKMTYYKDYFMSLSELKQRLQCMLHSVHKAIGQLRVSPHQLGIEVG